MDEQTTKVLAKHNQSHLKLPKLEFHKFHGDVLGFQNFRDQSEAAVHKIQTFQMFKSLRTCDQPLTVLHIRQRRKSPASCPWRAGYSDPNKK